MGAKTGDITGWRGRAKFLSSPAIVFYLMPWLIVLITAGTIAQKELGLFAAQKIFFSSWIIWFGPLPLPGAYPALGLLSLSLLYKFLFNSPWRMDRIGTILTHLGVLVLLIGGLLTAMTQKEGYLILGKGAASSDVFDYHARVLMVQKDGADFAAIPFDTLEKGKALSGITLPFTAVIDNTCQNCRPAPVKDAAGRQGLAQQMALASTTVEPEDEANLSGATLKLSGLPDDQNGIYITLEEIPHKPTVSMDGHEYAFFLSRAKTSLPFSIELQEFKKEMHPGTNTARSYSSDIIVRDNGIEWPYHIRMNEPLRYKGYTFYQSSFSERPDGVYSILSTVENKGRAFPYIASFLIFAGLLGHLILRLWRKKEEAA